MQRDPRRRLRSAFLVVGILGLLAGAAGAAPVHGAPPGVHSVVAIAESAPSASSGKAGITVAAATEYPVQFTEVGLPDGVSWSISANGTTLPQFPAIPVADRPFGDAFDPLNGQLYVTQSDSDSVAVIDPSTNHVLKTIPTDTNPRRVAFDPTNGYLYVSCTDANNITVINGATDKVVRSIAVGPNPIGEAYDPSDNRLFVADSNINGTGTLWANVSVINPNTSSIVARIPVGNDARDLVYDPANHDVYVENYDSGNLTVIGARNETVFASISLGGNPEAATVVNLAGEDELFVGDNPGYVAVVNASSQSVVTDLGAGSYPSLGAFDPVNDFVYIGNVLSDQLSVFDASTLALVGSLYVGAYPVGISFDSTTDFLYVANADSNSVMAINGSSSTLPAGTLIPTMVLHDVVAGGYGSIEFGLANGTYTFDFNRTAGFVAFPPNLVWVIDGFGGSGTIDFSGTGAPPSPSTSPSSSPPAWEFLLGGAIAALVATNVAWLLYARSARPPGGPGGVIPYAPLPPPPLR